jgi:hypothetical protein
MRSVLVTGYIAAGLHLLLFAATVLFVIYCDRLGGTEACPLILGPLELLDYPVFIIFGPLAQLSSVWPIAIAFAIGGTLQWFVLGLLAGVIYRAIRNRPNQTLQPTADRLENYKGEIRK